MRRATVARVMHRTITTGLLACLLSGPANAQADHVDFDRDLLVLKPDKQLEVRILRVTAKQLGYLKGAGGWLVPVQGPSLPLAGVSKRRADSGIAWELGSLHYALRADAPLPRARALLRDLEWFYRAFFARYGVELQLDDGPER